MKKILCLLVFLIMCGSGFATIEIRDKNNEPVTVDHNLAATIQIADSTYPFFIPFTITDITAGETWDIQTDANGQWGVALFYTNNTQISPVTENGNIVWKNLVVNNYKWLITPEDGYSGPTKIIPFLANCTSNECTMQNLSFNIEITITSNQQNIHEIFNDDVSEGSTLELSNGADMVIESVFGNEKTYISFSDCNQEDMIIAPGDEKTITCKGDQLKILVTDVDTISSTVHLKISTTGNIEVETSEADISGLKIVPIAGNTICPGRLAMLRVTQNGKLVKSDTIAIFKSNGEAVGNVEITNGFGQFIVPKDEAISLSLTLVSTNEGKVLPINSMCPAIELETNSSKNLSIIFQSGSDYQIGLNQEKVCGIAYIRDPNGNGVEGATVVASGPEFISTQSGVIGYTNLCFSKEGTYVLRAEKPGYSPSGVVEVHVTKELPPPPKDRVTLIPKDSEGNTLATPLEKLQNVTFEMVNQDGQRVDWSGYINMVVDNSSRPVHFDHGLTRQYLDNGEVYTFELSRISDFDSMDQSFYVESSYSIFGTIFKYVLWVVVIGIIGIVIYKLLFKKRKTEVEKFELPMQ